MVLRLLLNCQTMGQKIVSANTLGQKSGVGIEGSFLNQYNSDETTQNRIRSLL